MVKTQFFVLVNLDDLAMNILISNRLLHKTSTITFAVFLSCIAAITDVSANQEAGKLMPSIEFLLNSDSAQAGEPVEHHYPKNSGPDKNPMKGWNAAWWHGGREETSVGFQYIPWRMFEPNNDEFDKSAVENIIDRPGSDGRHLILRINCDWGGLHDISDPEIAWQGRSADCPEWMYEEVGVAHITGMHKGDLDHNNNPIAPTVTDFNSAAYLEQAEQAIAKLAEFYDGDPRIYAIQLGFLGYWGEWHAHGSNLDPEGGYQVDRYSNAYIISDQAKQRVYDAYNREFSSVRFMSRYPNESVLENVSDIGFHNDFFMPERDESAGFDDEVSARELWKQGPIGGEAPPEFGKVNDENGIINPNQSIVLTTPRGMEMIEAGHYTTMLISGTPTDQDLLEGYMALHRKMGYNYQIDTALFLEKLDQGEPFNITLSVDNIGVAPFYYDWKVEYALLNSNNQPVTLEEAVDYDLREMMPNSNTVINGSISTANLATGEYQVAVRFIQPGSEDNKTEQWELLARNTYMIFSNDIAVIDGVWNANNALVGGWSILGNLTVE